MYYIYENKRGNPVGSPIANAPTDLKARHECARLMRSGYFSDGLWAENHSTRKFFIVRRFGKDRLLYTNDESTEKKLDLRGNVIRKGKKDWHPFGL